MILSRLRTATAESHQRAQAAMPALDELGSASGYGWSVRALQGFFLAWEPRLFAVLAPLAVPLALEERRKLPLLVRDMEALHLSFASEVADPPPASSSSMPGALGAMYVLEGSTLGGQMIERHCAARLGVSPSNGGAFFHGYGPETGRRWQSFGGVLESYVSRHGGETAVIDGACGCFGALERWLARQLPFRPRPAVELLVGWA